MEARGQLSMTMPPSCSELDSPTFRGSGSFRFGATPVDWSGEQRTSASLSAVGPHLITYRCVRSVRGSPLPSTANFAEKVFSASAWIRLNSNCVHRNELGRIWLTALGNSRPSFQASNGWRIGREQRKIQPIVMQRAHQVESLFYRCSFSEVRTRSVTISSDDIGWGA
jgi:hypothetical protein